MGGRNGEVEVVADADADADEDEGAVDGGVR